MNDALTTTSPIQATMSQNIGAICAALAKAQGEIKLPEKNRTVTVQTKTGGKYTFDYADLAAINAVIREPLAKNGLAYTSLISSDERGPILVTMLMHSSGEWMRSIYRLPASSDPKDMGGAITYGKRYCLSALLGVVADDDNDADSDHLTEQPRAKNQPQAQAPQVKAGPVSPLAPAQASQRPSPGDLAKLFAALKQNGKSNEEFQAYLKEAHGISSSRDMTADQYRECFLWLQTVPPQALNRAPLVRPQVAQMGVRS